MRSGDGWGSESMVFAIFMGEEVPSQLPRVPTPCPAWWLTAQAQDQTAYLNDGSVMGQL